MIAPPDDGVARSLEESAKALLDRAIVTNEKTTPVLDRVARAGGEDPKVVGRATEIIGYMAGWPQDFDGAAGVLIILQIGVLLGRQAERRLAAR